MRKMSCLFYYCTKRTYFYAFLFLYRFFGNSSDHGMISSSKSAVSLFPVILVSMYSIYSYGFRPFIFALSIMLYAAPLALAPLMLLGCNHQNTWFLMPFKLEFSIFKSSCKKPEAISFIIKHLDSITWSIGKNKQAMIQDIHVELRCNDQSKTINLFSHVTKLFGNIDIFDFIGINNHSMFSNKILRFCLEQEIWWSISKSITSLLLSRITDRKVFSSSRIKAFCL